MKQINNILEHFGSALIMCVRAFSYLPTLPRQWTRLIEQCYLIGYTTFPSVAQFFHRKRPCAQGRVQPRSHGGEGFHRRAGGPVARPGVGARHDRDPGRGTRRLGDRATMKVYQEVDALVTMNIPPERILVLPRLVAILIMMPVLAISANLIGWIGGAIIAQNVDFIQLDSRIFFQGVRNFVDFRDIVDGLIKAEIFGFFIILVSCNVGLRTVGGPREIGASVTRAVVISLILILVLDYFVTSALLRF